MLQEGKKGEARIEIDPVDHLVLTIITATSALKSAGEYQRAYDTLSGELSDLRLEARHMEEGCLIMPFRRKK